MARIDVKLCKAETPEGSMKPAHIKIKTTLYFHNHSSGLSINSMIPEPAEQRKAIDQDYL